MKLYTKEQVIQAMTKSFIGHIESTDYDYDLEYKILNDLTPIELPSDEEIKVEAQSQWGNVDRTGVLGFINCARWMKNQILNQKK